MPRRSLLFSILGVVAFAALAAPAAADAAKRFCDPIQTEHRYRGQVPTAEQVLGFPLGSREVTAAESNRYVDAVAAASPRVVAGTVTLSWQGRPLRYAIAGRSGNVTRRALARIREAVRALMDPHVSAREAARLARRSPAILWLAGNVHGNEESGTDSELRILYELADRADCAARQILRNALVVIVPTQNPDGREADTRENYYGFDMNRDWFARTQREIDGLVQVLRRYPGQLFVDAHEMGTEGYFFPPNADPIYHEHTDFTVQLTDNLYGPAMAAEFQRQGIPFWQNEVFDFFAPVYGDTVPSHIVGAVGMTFEKYNGDPIEQRTYEHYVTQWVSLSQGAIHRQEILRWWHAEWVKAYRQGLAGHLEPNEVNDPGSVVTRQVPQDPVRHYFLRADDPTKAAELQRLVRRLQRTDVAVYRLRAPLAVPDYKEYGRAPVATVLPAGTYWIPMAQAKKHWIQALLNEDTYVPFPYFYDVSGWSNPLLLNLSGGRSGAVLRPVASLARRLAEPDAPALPAELPSVAVYQLSATSTSARQSTGWLRYLLEQRWHVPYRLLTSADIAGGALAGVEVLLVPNGPSTSAYDALGPEGQQALVDWVNAGGRYVGWRGGAALAALVGVTTAQLSEPTSNVAGALLRVLVDEATPLGAGVGPYNWVYYDYDYVMTASDPAHVAVVYPDVGSPDFFISGYGEGHEELGGTAAVVDEPVGAGRAVIFSIEPNFRAWTEGTQRFLWNAIFGASPTDRAAARAGSAARANEEASAQAAAESLVKLQSPLRVTVASGSALAAQRLLERYDAQYVVRRSPGKVSFLVANPRELAAEEHPFAPDLAEDLFESDIRVVAFSTP